MKKAILVLICATLALTAASDPWIGTWRMVPGKSKYQTGPLPKSMVIQYRAVGAGLKYAATSLDADGKQTTSTFVAEFDGKPYPVTGTRKWAPVVLKRIDGRTVEASYSLHGRLVAVSRSGVSEDGQTMTVTTRSQNGRGGNFLNVGTFRKD